MENQCLSLAEALGLQPEVKRIALRAPWRWLPPSFNVRPLAGLDPKAAPLIPPWPAIMIATGRKTAAVAAEIRKRAAGRCFAIQIQNPTLDPARFDAVVLPRHDAVRHEGVIATLGGLGRVTPEVLAAHAASAPAALTLLPEPRVVLLVGGPNAVYRMSATLMAEHLDSIVTAVKMAGGSLLISASNRTPPDVMDVLGEAQNQLPALLWRDGRDGENPYLSYLALADHLLVTGDSVNMLSEAAATGKPLHLLPLPGGSTKFERFHESLRQAGIARNFTGCLDEWRYEPLQETRRVADLLRARLVNHLARLQDGDLA